MSKLKTKPSCLNENKNDCSKHMVNKHMTSCKLDVLHQGPVLIPAGMALFYWLTRKLASPLVHKKVCRVFPMETNL